MTAAVVVETLVKAAIVILGLLTGFAYLTLFERKVQARLQQRYGPNRVGPFGLLQPAADGLKLMFKSQAPPAGRNNGREWRLVSRRDGAARSPLN